LGGRGDVAVAGTLALAEALALDDDLVSVVSEPVERALGEDRVVEQGDPLLDGAVAGDDGRGAAVALEDHLVEVARLLRAQAAQAEVVEDEQIGGEQPAEDLLGRVVGARLVQGLEHAVGAEEEHVAAGPAGGVAQRAGEEGLAHAHGPEEDHVLLALEEAEGEEVLDPVAVEGDGGVPVEALEGLLLLEAGPGQAQGEVLVVAAVDLVLEDELEEVELRELRLPGVGDAVGERRQQARELQALEHGLERLADLGRHGSRSPFGG